MAAAQNGRLLLFLAAKHGDRSATAEDAHDHLVGDHIHMQLILALHVDGAVFAEHVLQAHVANLVRDDLGRQADGADDPTEIARCARVARFLLQDERLERDEVVGDHPARGLLLCGIRHKVNDIIRDPAACARRPHFRESGIHP